MALGKKQSYAKQKKRILLNIDSLTQQYLCLEDRLEKIQGDAQELVRQDWPTLSFCLKIVVHAKCFLLVKLDFLIKTPQSVFQPIRL